MRSADQTLMKSDGATLRGEWEGDMQTHEQLSLLKVHWHAVVCQCIAGCCAYMLFVATFTSRSKYGSTLHLVQCLVPPELDLLSFAVAKDAAAARWP